MFTPLLSLGWEYDESTKGYHFTMLTSHEDGIGFDAYLKAPSQINVFGYSFFLGGQGPETQAEVNQILTIEELRALTLKVLKKGYEENDQICRHSRL